jgi:hypothetical protein
VRRRVGPFVRRSIAALLLTVTLAACSGTPSVEGPGSRSGIRGVVTAGPGCPVVVQGSPCPDGPWRGTVEVRTTDGEVVRAIETDDRGRFSIEIEPGSYEVTPVGVLGRPSAGVAERVEVEHGAFAEVALVVDTGIR